MTVSMAVSMAKLTAVATAVAMAHLTAIKLAVELGFTTVWVNRPSRCPSVGVAPPADASPDYEVPDMRSLAAAAGL